jgi:protein kinase-like protein
VLEPGTVVGPYRIDGLIGRGGMAVVYEATHESMGRLVALKILGGELGADPEFVQRFRREGRLQASLDHPHVITVYDAGESEHGLFLAMRLVRGPTLAQLLSQRQLNAERALRLLGQVAQALDAAHAAGLVHRDIKPQNVLVAEGDHAYLADFGLTKMGGGTDVTVTGGLVGTLSYLAPEVIRGKPATPASDRYAFAAMLFECLTGGTVFPRSSHAAVLFAQMSEPPPSISQRRTDLPEALDDVLLRALAKDPDTRPDSATALLHAVSEALGPEKLGSLGPPPPPRAPEPPATTVEPLRLGGVEPKRPRRPVPLVAAGALAGAGIVAAIFLAAGSDEDAPSPADEPAPPIAADTEPLGSALAPGEFETLDCNGRPATPGSPACSVAQAELPGRTLVVPEDGVVTSWAVRGARGELHLQVLRPRGPDYAQVAKSQYQVASDESVHRWPTSLDVQANDILAAKLAPGAAIGVRAGVDGATTNRWLEPPNPQIPPTHPPRTGFDHEILLRVEYVAGGEPERLEQVSGPAADAAPAGHELRRRSLTFPRGGPTIEVALVELRDTVALDLFRGERRVHRIKLPSLIPGGTLVDMGTVVYPDSPEEAGVGMTWINLDSGRAYEHSFGVTPHRFLYYGQ